MANEIRGGTNTIAARLAEQIFVAGLSRAQVALLVDCALITHFKALPQRVTGVRRVDV